jgi:hypothetical protein
LHEGGRGSNYFDVGRDAIGRYLLGLMDDPVYAEFSLEAKCYQPGLDGVPINQSARSSARAASMFSVALSGKSVV